MLRLALLLLLLCPSGRPAGGQSFATAKCLCFGPLRMLYAVCCIRVHTMQCSGTVGDPNKNNNRMRTCIVVHRQRTSYTDRQIRNNNIYACTYSYIGIREGVYARCCINYTTFDEALWPEYYFLLLYHVLFVLFDAPKVRTYVCMCRYACALQRFLLHSRFSCCYYYCYYIFLGLRQPKQRITSAYTLYSANQIKLHHPWMIFMNKLCKLFTFKDALLRQ